MTRSTYHLSGYSPRRAGPPSALPRFLNNRLRRGLAAAALVALLITAEFPAARAEAAPTDKPVPESVAIVTRLALFPEYVVWPNSAFANATAPIVIGVFGHDPFAGSLEEIIEDRKQKFRRLDRPVEVRYFASIGELRPCHMLYVPWAEQRRWASIARHYAQQPVLLVADVARAGDGFTAGFHLEFRQKDDEVIFAIDLARAEACGLKLSADLLSFADEVERPKPPGNPPKPATTRSTPPR